MLDKLKKFGALFSVLRKGRAVVNKAAWKANQISVNSVVGLLSAGVVVARLYGVDLQISDADLLVIGGGVYTVLGLLFNPYVTAATSEACGLPSKPDVPPTEPPKLGEHVIPGH
jgi:hypothetical protein